MAGQSLTVLDAQSISWLDAAGQLARSISGQVRFGEHDRNLYSTDASIYQVRPLGVVIPQTSADLPIIIDWARRHQVPVLPRGGGTSLAGQCTNEALVVDCSSNLTALLDVDAQNRTCTVEPGITIADLNARLRPHKLFFAPDPATIKQANVGGCIGNNAAGTRSIRYGRTVENVVAVDCLLSSGHVVKFGADQPRGELERQLARDVIRIVRQHERAIRRRYATTRRRNAGYALDMILAQLDECNDNGRDPVESLDLTPLVCGSEGTLGFVTQATLKLHPVPAAQGLAVLTFESIDHAIAAVPRLLEIDPSAVELLDDLILGLAVKNPQCQRFLAQLPVMNASHGSIPGAVLYVEFLSQTGPTEIDQRLHALQACAKDELNTTGFAVLQTAQTVDAAMSLRRAGEPLLHAIAGKRKPVGFVEDNAIPVEHLREFVRRFDELVRAEGTRASFYAHASVGVLHVRPLLDLRDVEDRARMERLAIATTDLARELGGVMSGEHGDGRSRGPLLERYFGPELMHAFAQVKSLFDPANLFNPGMIVDPCEIQSIHESTRISAAPLENVKTELHFDYGVDGGFVHAVEKCNGAGVCRKTLDGTMCPSYMALRDERHSTRGRANALRLAVTGQLNEFAKPVWNDRETLNTLDLCLSCKACKSECPTSVDLAMYKAEYLAQSHAMGIGPVMRDRIVGAIDRVGRLGSQLAPWSNWLAEIGWLKRLAGIAPQRTLPRFERALEAQWPASLAGVARQSGDKPTVILIADCFTNYIEPQIGLDTLAVFRALGYEVALLTGACCGRAAISTGMLERARRLVDRAAPLLDSAVKRWNPQAVIVCEPSCASSIADDWITLKTDATGRLKQRLAPMCTLPESFISENWSRHPRRVEWAKPAGRVALHGHCHQKALWSADPTIELLGRIAGPENVNAPDTGCCGMAGPFGLAAHRYDLSMKIGAARLFPMVDQLGPHDNIIAPGTSCRHQIREGTGKNALHPMTWLKQHLTVQTPGTTPWRRQEQCSST